MCNSVVITITFAMSIVCLALTVSRLLSCLIPTINIRRLNRATESLNNLFSLTQLAVMKSGFEPGKQAELPSLLD